MYDNKRGKWLVIPGKKNKHVRGHPLLNQKQLADDVAKALQQIYLELGEGLPDCVYQLKLQNDLTRKGFRLQAEEAMLNHSVKPELVRSIIVINEALVNEYVTSSRATYQPKKWMTFDLDKSSCASGLLTNLTEDKKKVCMTEIKKTNTYH